MYAIIKTSGNQYKVQPGTVIDVDRVSDAEPGDTISLTENALFLKQDDGSTHVGTPTLTNTTIECDVEKHFRGPKLSVFKMKPKKRYRRRQGHRQDLTRLVVKDIKTADK